MEGQDDLARYYGRFLALTDPLVFSRYVSKREYNEPCFGKAFTPTTVPCSSPTLSTSVPTSCQEQASISESTVRTRRLCLQRLAAETEAEVARRRKLAQEEDQGAHADCPLTTMPTPTCMSNSPAAFQTSLKMYPSPSPYPSQCKMRRQTFHHPSRPVSVLVSHSYTLAIHT